MSYNLDVQAVIDAFPHYVFVLDEEHRIYAANAAMLDYLKSTTDDLQGKCCQTIVHGTETPVCDCPLEKAKLTGGAVEEQVDDPELGWILTAVYPMASTTAEGKDLFVHIVRPLD